MTEERRTWTCGIDPTQPSGKQIVDRIPPGVFVVVVELALVAAGVALLIGGSSQPEYL